MKFVESGNAKELACAYLAIGASVATLLMSGNENHAKPTSINIPSPTYQYVPAANIIASSTPAPQPHKIIITSNFLHRLAERNGGHTAIAVRSLDGQIKASTGGNTQMPTRSSYKLYTAYATLRAIEAQKIHWSSPIWMGKSVEDTMAAMIVQSNNEAAEALKSNPQIGTPDTVTKMLRDDVGLSDETFMGGGRLGANKSPNSQSTANDFLSFLLKLDRHELPGVNKASSYRKLEHLMEQATTNGVSARDGIAAGVGQSVIVADKPGWAPGPSEPASNDVGIVFLKDKPYSLAILSDKPNQWNGVAAIARSVNSKIVSAN